MIVSGNFQTAQADRRALTILMPWSCAWMSANEYSTPIVAGPQGAELLTLQLPDK